MLAWLPFVSAFVLERLYDYQGGAAVYRSLSRLREEGLIEAIRPPLEPGCSPQRFYLTDLGLAAVALDQQLDLHHVANRLHLRGPNLSALLPSLPQLAALYDLLGALVASGSVQPSMLAWHRPWRYRFQPPNGKNPLAITLPGAVALSWEGRANLFLLLPDLGQVPLSTFRPTISRLFALQRWVRLPTLVIATSGAGRAAAWEEMLDSSRERHHDSALPTYVTRWADLPTRDAGLLARTGHVPEKQLRGRLALDPLRPRRASRPLPRLVGDAVAPRRWPDRRDELGHRAMVLSPADRALLELVGKHPFLSLDSLATVLHERRAALRHRRDRLIELGFVRLVSRTEIGEKAVLELGELAVDGMKILAAGHGLSLARAITCHGLTGGGPAEAVGARHILLANLDHTLGADAVFVRLYETTHQLTGLGADNVVLEWQNGTAASRRHFRPDGYGRYYRGGRVYDFYLEYDRATMWARGYEHKFNAYYEYWKSLRWYQNQEHFPTVLVVTVSDAAEERIAQAALEMGRWQYYRLPLLLTCQWRIDENRNGLGLLGPIWRAPDADIEERRHWLPIVDPDPNTV